MEALKAMESEFAESGPPQRPVDRGRGFPLGATVLGEGVNFSVFSRQASRLDLLLFDDAAATHPTRVVELDPRAHRTYHYWHVFMPGIRPGQIYAYRADGPLDPERGLRFDPTKAPAVTGGQQILKSRRDERQQYPRKSLPFIRKLSRCHRPGFSAGTSVFGARGLHSCRLWGMEPVSQRNG